MALLIPCAACGYQMREHLVGISFRQFAVNGRGRTIEAPDEREQHILCQTCAGYFEQGFGELEAQAMVRQANVATYGANR